MPNTYNGLSFEEFDKALMECKSLWEANDEVERIFQKHVDAFGGFTEFFMPLQSDTVLHLLECIMQDEAQWISYWCTEANFGDYEGDKVWDAEDQPISLHTTRELWDFLMEERLLWGSSDA